MPSFFVQSFGCRASQADGAAIETALEARGLTRAAASNDAELVILNTCTVTSTADDELRQIVRRVHRHNPGSRIVVTGCYAQRAPEEITGIPGVALVVGNSHKTLLPDLLESAPFHGEVHVGDIFEQREFLSAPVEDASGDRTRPNLKIQDGCNNRCSFCVIPSVRGRSRSASPEQVIGQVRALATRYREIVLTGINLGRWGREPGIGMRLPELVRRLLDQTGVERLRLSSVEPMDFSDELIDLIASSRGRVARHVHTPLQSGSDSVLRRMHRRYRPQHYQDRVRTARTSMPDAAIGADVMAGFPGETECEFEESRAFIESLPFTYLHVFTYSERPGTKAESLPDSVPMSVRKERNAVLREIGRRKNLEFRRRLLGSTLSVVTLDPPGRAISSNYVQVQLAAPAESNRLMDVVAGGLSRDGVLERGALPVL